MTILLHSSIHIFFYYDSIFVFKVVGSWAWPDVWSFMGRFPTCVSNIMREHKSRDLNQLDLIILNDSTKS